MSSVDTLLLKSAANLLAEAGLAIGGSAPEDPHIKDPHALRRIFLLGSLGLGDTYVDGAWTCARLDAFITKVLTARLDTRVGGALALTERVRAMLFNLQSVRRAFVVGESHYNIGNDLFEAMLGPTMAYSAAYFKGGAQTLDEAQRAKFERVCAELQLRSGARIVEIGAGFGTFAEYAAAKHGAHVTGLTVSTSQKAYAEARLAPSAASFILSDYRTFAKQTTESFDHAVSLEMIEAVGGRNLRSYFNAAHQLIRPGGSFLLQAIMGSGEPDLWISTRIFPNGVLPSWLQLTAAMDGLFRIERVESFGDDYDKTLMLWHAAFLDAWPQLSAQKNADGSLRYDARFFRLWQYYLLACAGVFRSRTATVSQILLSRL